MSIEKFNSEMRLAGMQSLDENYFTEGEGGIIGVYLRKITLDESFLKPILASSQLEDLEELELTYNGIRLRHLPDVLGASKSLRKLIIKNNSRAYHS